MGTLATEVAMERNRHDLLTRLHMCMYKLNAQAEVTACGAHERSSGGARRAGARW